MTIGLDRDAVDEYVRLNPLLETVDEFLRELVASGFIREEVVRRCKIVANLLDSGDMHLVLENLEQTDTVCAMAAERIADRINNPPTSDDDDTSNAVTANPQVAICKHRCFFERKTQPSLQTLLHLIIRESYKLSNS